jgi:hypothetical protein
LKRSRRIRFALTLIAVCAMWSCAIAPTFAADDKREALDRVLGRVARYMTRYEPQLSSVLAEEHYEQQSMDGTTPSEASAAT